MRIAKIIATCFGIGYIQKGAGTVAALFCCILWYVFKGTETGLLFQAVLLILLFFVGVASANVVEKAWGKDSNRVVIDEFHGMLLALFLVPLDWRYFLAASLLFRFFDIAKPLAIRRMEAFTGGWGVMMDDLLAGLYSNLLLHAVLKSHLFS